MPAIKNYSSEINIARIFERIQHTLVAHGAKQVILNYGEDGKIQGVRFVIQTSERGLPITLPARVDKVQALLKAQYAQGIIKDRRVLQPEQAYRVAWRNILDWLEAQMALLDIQMVKLEEIFLPYITDPQGRTLFEFYEGNRFHLSDGEENR